MTTTHLRPCCRVVGPGLLLSVLAFLLAGALPLSAAQPVLRSFDLPAGDAATTLRQFASQAAEQLVIPAEAVRGVQTNAVRGSYTAREALNRMTAGTPLVVVQDEQTGALAIRRDSPSGSGGSFSNFANPSGGFGAITGRVQNIATGQYLNNARVSIRGTEIVAETDETGRYRLANVPAGIVVLDALYTGLDPQQVSVVVNAGVTTTQNFDLTSIARYGRADDIVQLSSFVVASSREMEGQALAIHEQRYAANVKNVVSSDTHGDVTAGNVAELMKFIPGIAIIEGGDGNANQVSVRGLAANLTQVAMDGAQVAHPINAGNTRDFDFKGVNINSVARVEVTKVPTPSNPADSLGGAVNMISKSAFERSRAEFRYRAYFSVNGEDFTFSKTPFPYERKTYKAIPGIDITYTKPVNENFGFVVNAASNIAYNVQDIETMTWNGGGTATGATPTNPYLQSYQFVDAPKYIYRQAASTKLDWRVSPNAVLSLNLLGSRFRDDNANYSRTINAGTNGNALANTGGVAMTFGPDFTSGASGRGAVTFGGGHHHITQTLMAQNLRYRLDNGIWRVSAGLSHSRGHGYNNALGRYSHFNNLGIALRDPARVVFTGTQGTRPDRVQVFNSTNQQVDLEDPNSYVINTTTTGQMRNTRDTIRTGDLALRRSLTFLPMPAALEIGGSRREQVRDTRRPTYAYTYNGINGDRSPTPFLAQIYKTPSPLEPSRNIPWASPRLAYLAWEHNPSLFTPTLAQQVAARTSEVTTSEYVKETVSAYYVQGEIKLFHSRLNLLTGVRYEKTDTQALGPLIDPAAVWVRNPDGSFARTPTGARIRKPEAGAANSLEQLALTHTERGYRASRSYDGYYPSAHLTYNVTENLLVRFAYAKTYGRPNFNEIIPNTTVEEADIDPETNPEANPGRINVRNTGLEPWSADNFDLSVEYYTNKGGLFSAGVFRKDITDFFGAIATLVTAENVEQYGLDPRYIGWTVSTKINAGDARISGFEFNARHSLGFLGPWGDRVQAFVNGTKLKLEGGAEADWRGFMPEMLNWGFTASWRPITLMAQWTYRGEAQNAPVATMGTNAFTFRQPRTSMDLNVDYQLKRNFSFFVNVRNVFNEYFTNWVYGPQTPDYAKFRTYTNNGVQYALGVKGTF